MGADPPIQPGDGGVGYSWFAVEVTSAPVPEGPVFVDLTRGLQYRVLAPVAVEITRGVSYRVLAAEQEPIPEFGGGGERLISGGGLALEGEDVELRIPVVVEVQLPDFEQRIPVVAVLDRTVEFRHRTEIAAERDVVLLVSAERVPAERWNRLLSEDEELVALGIL